MAEAQVVTPALEEQVTAYPPAAAEASEQHPAAEQAPKEEKVLEATEEKTVEAAEEKTDEEVARELLAAGAAGSPVPDKSFKEESYRIGDLKESERKALEDFKLKVEEALKARSFEKPPKPETTRELEVAKPSDEAEKKDESESKDGEAEAQEESEAKVVDAEVKPEKTELAAETSASSYEEPPPPPVESKEEAPPAPAVEVAATEVAAPVYEEPEKEEAPPPAPSEPVVTDTIAEGSAVEGTIEVPVEGGGEDVVVEKTTRDVAIEEKEGAAPPEDYSLWGVPLLHTKGDERTDVILLKFLRARDYKVNDAFDMLKNTVIWRKEFFASSVEEEDLGAEFNTVAYMHGYDKDGHPVCYNDYSLFQDKELYNKAFGDESSANKFLRWRIQVVEKSIQNLNFSPGGVHSLVQITDLKHSPGFLKWINITNKALTLLQDNYPELVAKQIFINVPWYFSALYSIYGRLITQRQKSKVVVARPGKLTETLFKYISPENVPVKYGGLSRPNDTEFEGVEGPAKVVIIKAGEKQIIELPVEEPGVTVVWDLVVVGWDVVYSEEFVPSAESGYTVIVKKSKRLVASEEPIRNAFKVAEPGKILLTIDNSASRRKRSVLYRHLVKKPIPVESY